MRSGRDRKYRRNGRKSGSRLARYFYRIALKSIDANLLYSGALGDSRGGSVVKFASMMNRPKDNL